MLGRNKCRLRIRVIHLRRHVLYGGTAIALRLGHRVCVDFDFFHERRIAREWLQGALPFEPDRTSDGVLLVASLDDLMAAKLKTILRRSALRTAEAARIEPPAGAGQMTSPVRRR